LYVKLFVFGDTGYIFYAALNLSLEKHDKPLYIPYDSKNE